jgi:hypothetical protein
MSDNVSVKSELSLLELMPQVLRARDFRLYTRDGRRLIDLWQNGGAAVLGHTPPSLLREIKNTASRGLYAPYPHFTGQRFFKALSHILPGRSFRIYAVPPPGIKVDASVTDVTAHNATASEAISPLNAALWRPYLDFCLPTAAHNDNAAQETNAPDIVIPVLPGIQGWRSGLPFGQCVCAALSGLEDVVFRNFPPNDMFPPVVTAAATRGIWDLIAAVPARANIQWQRINKIIKSSPWQRRGIYLFPHSKPAPEVWALLFRRFLDAGFLLPPVPEHPIVLPGILSPGEEAKLAEILTERLP